MVIQFVIEKHKVKIKKMAEYYNENQGSYSEKQKNKRPDKIARKARNKATKLFEFGKRRKMKKQYKKDWEDGSWQ